MMDAPRSVYQHVGELIAALVGRFGLDASRALIMQTYEDICRDSLAFPMGARPPGPSRINHDGTPIQFAATVGPGPRTLQFLGEAGAPGLGQSTGLAGRERNGANRACIATVAERLGLDGALASIAPLLDALAPEKDIDLLADPGGAYWVGVAFPAGHAPHLRIYVNARWGQDSGRWARLGRLAEHFGCAPWPEIAARLAPDLEPLGVAITLGRGKPPTGRIYLTAYGKRMRYYEELAADYGDAGLAQQVRILGESVLGDDYRYPTQTAVCSFGLGQSTGLGQSAMPDYKFELCAHCLFESDLQAAARLGRWLERAGLDATDYSVLLDLFSAGHPSDRTLDLHCYAGVGTRSGALYGTVYIKPRIGVP